MAIIGTDIKEAARLLQAGELVAIPTETVYGLAANAFSEAAVVKIFEAKDRPAFDPLIVHTHSVAEFSRIAMSIPDMAYRLAEAFMPGPLTLILPKAAQVPLLVTSGNDSVGLRIPNHPLTLQLLRELDFPLAAPSANPFGYVSPTTARHVEQQLGGRIPYILDGGACTVGIESTIISLAGGQVQVLRLGGLALEEIEQVLGRPVDRVQTSSSNPQAPGMLSSHYAPRKKVVLGHLPELLEQYAGRAVGILAFSSTFAGVPASHQVTLSPAGDVREAAQRLFSALRALDEQAVEVILAEYVPEVGLGRAVNDRLRRASR
jgi:L-threonylcarbamoyladenylate synthase